MANTLVEDRIVVADTVTKLGEECVGRVVVGGSHGGAYAAYLACKAGARAVILNDAGRGKDDAGIGGGAYCAGLGIPYATLDTMSCRIGNGESMIGEGIVSYANPIAASLGIAAGMSALDAARALARASRVEGMVPTYAEARKSLPDEPGRRSVVLMDSISLVEPGDGGSIVVSGSHGGMLGNDPSTAVRGDAFAAFFNDAGGGKDGAGLTRLPALDGRGIAAGTVAAMSARIGDGESTYRDGVLSHVNEVARRLGGAAGMRAKDFIDSLRDR